MVSGSGSDGYNAGWVAELLERWQGSPRAVEPAWRDELARLAASEPAVTVAPSAEDRLKPAPLPSLGPEIEGRVPLLQSVRLFCALPLVELAALAARTDELAFAPGDAIFRQGDEGSDLYVLVDGRVEIVKDGVTMAELQAGEVLGEMAVLDRVPRSADAIALTPLRVLRMRGEELLARLDENPALGRALIQDLTARIREKHHKQDVVDQLIRAYRSRGHRLARLDPLGPPPDVQVPELQLDTYGLEEADLDTPFSSSTIAGTEIMTLRQIVDLLRETYCGSIGVQFMHIDSPAAKDWLQREMEDRSRHRRLERGEQLRILSRLTDAEVFEQFIHRKFIGAKRFSLEGAETLVPLLDLALEEAGATGVREIVIGMPHRGRLNILANIIGKSPRHIFREFDDADHESKIGRGDVKYHLGFSSDFTTSLGHELHLSLTFNPSHLEFVAPVVEGRVRAKQKRRSDVEHREVMGLVIHGDAAFAGQGVVQELFNLSELSGYRTGGTLHIVVNNQIGFTTTPEEGRSTRYATDVARMLQTPIFHVNGEDPEAVAQVVRWALAYRDKFRRDVIVDMYCYRRYGHNEGDEPAFTQPLLYEAVRQRKSVREGYLENLLRLGGVSQEEADEVATRSRDHLEEALSAARHPDYKPLEDAAGAGIWRPYRGGLDVDTPEVATAIPADRLAALLSQLGSVPETFRPHPKLARLLGTRIAMAEGERPLDWAAAELLAFGTLLAEGYPVRLSGQDSQRGTFSHRHAVLHDVESGDRYTPLAHLSPDQGTFEVLNSPLTETGVLGFEYGYSLDSPEGLAIWEAQFGDFSNVAQVIIDQFITSGEDKWHRLSGLVLLLPHGFEGQGPEHSSARLERFLTLAAEDNIQVMNLTTPAQLFHGLRRQVLRPLRKPLVIMAPKSLLRLPAAVSSLDELATGRFHRVIADPEVPAPKRVVLTSGKLYYELLAARGDRPVAIVRLEQLYPLSDEALATALPYPEDTPVVWVQEEPMNMGAWGSLARWLGPRLLGRYPLSVVARPESASPATGSALAHRIEQEQIVAAALES